MKEHILLQLLAAARSRIIPYSLLTRCAIEAGAPANELLNELACYVAEQYNSRALSYNEADTIMNSVWGISTSPEFWAAYDSTIPHLVHQVYEAFDAGEYHHPQDAKDVDPVLKYTNPLIVQFLVSLHNDIQPGVQANRPTKAGPAA